MATVVSIVQARMSSVRLPGKMMLPFGGVTLLAHVLARLSASTSLRGVWVATTDLPADDVIERACVDLGVRVGRGSADDVLGRFAGVLDEMGERPDGVLRVCGDRPLLCPVLVDELVERFGALGCPDYLANNVPPSYPYGLDLEIVRTECLLAAANEATDPYDREHVTPFIYRRSERFRVVGYPCPFGNFASVRAAIDTEGDYRALAAVHESLARVRPDYDHRDVLNLATLDPAAFP
jgi:spore coat polysaccharide biosynthesis protein SpsF